MPLDGFEKYIPDPASALAHVRPQLCHLLGRERHRDLRPHAQFLALREVSAQLFRKRFLDRVNREIALGDSIGFCGFYERLVDFWRQHQTNEFTMFGRTADRTFSPLLLRIFDALTHDLVEREYENILA